MEAASFLLASMRRLPWVLLVVLVLVQGIVEWQVLQSRSSELQAAG